MPRLHLDKIDPLLVLQPPLVVDCSEAAQAPIIMQEVSVGSAATITTIPRQAPGYLALETNPRSALVTPEGGCLAVAAVEAASAKTIKATHLEPARLLVKGSVSALGQGIHHSRRLSKKKVPETRQTIFRA